MSFVTPTEAATSRGITLQQLYEDMKVLKAQGVGISEIGLKYNIRAMTVGGTINRLDRQSTQKAENKRVGTRPRDYLEAQARSKYGKPLRDLLTAWLADPSVTGTVMADRLVCAVSAIHYWLNKYGLHLSRDESHRRTRKTGRRNYEQIVSAGRKTLLRRAVKGSTVAEKVYNHLQLRLIEQPFPDFDVVIGMNQWHIIPPKEVDIAIVAIRQDRQTTWGRHAYTFAVEVDGETFHANKTVQDHEKDEILSTVGWRPMRIAVPHNSTETDLESAVDMVFATMLQMMIQDAGLDEDELRG